MELTELKDRFYDVIVIGAGVVGSAIARELTKYDLKVAVVEKEIDVGMGISCRNSGVIHAGFNYPPGSLRAKLCVRGRRILTNKICKELNVPFKVTGKILVGFNEEQKQKIIKLIEQGEKNGVEGLEIVYGEQTISNLQEGAKGEFALYSKATGIVSPYHLTIALAENAYLNGCKFFLGHKVVSANICKEGFILKTNKDLTLKSRWVVNAAGLFCDEVASFFGVSGYKIYPCRGEYWIIDKKVGKKLKMPVYPVPWEKTGGWGVHLTPTIDKVALIGPSAEYIDKKEDYSCTKKITEELIKKGKALWPLFDRNDLIRSYSGVRPKQTPPEIGGYKDFVISQDLPGLINLIGIESPGLTAAPAIAEMVVDIIGETQELKINKNFEPYIEGYSRFEDLPEEKKRMLVERYPDYGQIICRCEFTTKYELIKAIKNPFGVKSLNALKYRCRIGMGRCQGGYCIPHVVKILQEEFGFEPKDFHYKYEDDFLFNRRVRE